MTHPHLVAFQRDLDTLARTFGLPPPTPAQPPPTETDHPWVAAGVSRRVWRMRRAANRCPVHGERLVSVTRSVCTTMGCDYTRTVSR